MSQKKTPAKKEFAKKVSEKVILESIEKRAAAPIRKLKAVGKVKKSNFHVVADNLKQLKELKAEGTRQMNSIIEPMNTAVSKVRALFQPFFTKVASIEADYKSQMYKVIESAEEKKLSLDQAFSKNKISGITLEKKKLKESVDTGSATVRKMWTPVCLDEDKTPRKYLVPDEALIKEALMEGKSVPGWELRQVNNIAI